MSDKARIVGYVDEGQKQDIERLAEDADLSVSAWVAEAAREKIEREKFEELANRYRIEQRLLELVDTAADRAVDEITAEVRQAVRDELGENSRADTDSDDEFSGWGAKTE